MYVNNDNRERCLIMRGCPWKVTAEEIVEFFKGYGAMTTDDVFIEAFKGKRTGSAMAIFESQQIAQDAKENLQKGKIGVEQRYLQLFDHNDEFMQKICKLGGGAGDQKEEKKEEKKE